MSPAAAAPSARILERVREDAADLAVLATTPASDWQFVADRSGARVYEMLGDALPERVSTVRTLGKGGGGSRSEFYLVRAVTTVPDVDLNAVLDLLHTSSTDQFRALMKRLFDKHYENAAVVDSLSCTTPPPFAETTAPQQEQHQQRQHQHPTGPYAASGGYGGRSPPPPPPPPRSTWQMFTEDDGYSANWLTLRSFSKLGGLESHRDFTMVCYQDVFQRQPLSDRVERVGRRAARDPLRKTNGSKLLGVHTFSSMNFKDIPELPKSSKTDRLHWRNSGLVVEETSDGSNAVRLSLFLCLLPSKLVLKEVTQSPRMRAAQTQGGTMSKKFVKWLQTLALCVSNLAQAAKPELAVAHVADMAWAEADHCYLCLKVFRTYRRRHHCRFCGEAVCGACSGFVSMADFDVTYKSAHAGSNRYMLRPGYAKSNSNNNSMESEELADARGCTSCVSELKMNLAIKGGSGAGGGSSRGQSLDSLSNSSGSHTNLSQLASLGSTRTGSGRQQHLAGLRGSGPEDLEHYAASVVYCQQQPPVSPYGPSLPEAQTQFETRDQFAPRMHGGIPPPAYDQHYAHYMGGGKPSISTISSSSYSGLSPDLDRQQLMRSNVSSAASTDHYARSQGPQSFSGSSDASLSAFLARDPDILALRGLTLGSPGDSELRYRPTAGQMTVFESDSGDDDDYQGAMRMQKLQAGAGYRDSGRQSTATTVTMNEGSNHSQFHFANMTADEARAAAAIVSAAARTGGVASASSDRPPFAPAASRSSSKASASSSNSSSKIMYFGSSRPAARAAGGDSPSTRSVSSGASTGNDMIHLDNGKDFVVFSEPRQTEVLRRVDSSKDMIPLQL